MRVNRRKRNELTEIIADIRALKEDLCWIKKVMEKQERLIYALLFLVIAIIGKIGIDSFVLNCP